MKKVYKKLVTCFTCCAGIVASYGGQGADGCR